MSFFALSNTSKR